MIVSNNCAWTTLADKIDEIKLFFAPRVDLKVTVFHTNYTDIPFVPMVGQVSTNAAPGSILLQVDPTWYDYNVTPLGAIQDIVLFLIDGKQWPSTKTPVRGARTDRDQGPVELQVGAYENEQIGMVHDHVNTVYSAFIHFTCHEIMHALFMITGQNDTTHHWDYDMGNLSGALNDLSFNNMNTSDKPTIIQKITAPFSSLPVNNDLLNKMCAAIQSREGYIAPGVNAVYPNGTPAFRNCNPGNLRYAGQIGSIGQKNGFAVFPDYQTGLDALKRQILLVARGKSKVFPSPCTIQQFFHIYAPSTDGNDPESYADQVATAMGVTKTFSLSGIIG